VEKNLKTIAVALGRFQPPHRGHGFLIQSVTTAAKKAGADMEIFVIGSPESKAAADKSTNPLSVEERVKFLKAFFPGIIFSSAPNAYEAIWKLGQEGYEKVILVAGADRAKDYEKMIASGMKSKDEARRLLIKEFAVVTLPRDPDVEGIKGFSGTKMREAAVKNDFEAFRKMAPEGNEKLVRMLFDEVRKNILAYTKQKPPKQAKKVK
jgi:cytidyltransferase-like protein